MNNYPLLSDEELEGKPVYKDLPTALAHADNCYQLELSSDSVSTTILSEAFPRLPRLQVIVIRDHANLSFLPENTGELANLQYLEIRNSLLITLPANLQGCQHLTDVVISNCQGLGVFPAVLADCTNLVYLEVSQTEIPAIPAEIGNLTQLESLNLNENKLHTLPGTIGNLHSLAELRIYGNYAMSLPATAFMKLKALKTFDHGVIRFVGASKEEVQAALPEATFTQVTSGDSVYEE